MATAGEREVFRWTSLHVIASQIHSKPTAKAAAVLGADGAGAGVGTRAGVGAGGELGVEATWETYFECPTIALRAGPEARFSGAVINFAISRPSSPTRPCSSASSSRISDSSFSLP